MLNEQKIELSYTYYDAHGNALRVATKESRRKQGKVNVSNQVHERIKQQPKDDKTRECK